MFAPPRWPRSLPGVRGRWFQPDTPGTPEVTLQACPGEGTGAWHRSLLKKVLSGKAPPLWREPYLCTGSPPLPSPPIPKARSHILERGGWGSGEKAAECSMGNSRKWHLIDLTASAGRESAGSNHQLPLRRDLGRSPGEVLRAFKPSEHWFSMCNGMPPSLKGNLNQLSWQHTQEMKGYKHHLLYSGIALTVSAITLPIF